MHIQTTSLPCYVQHPAKIILSTFFVSAAVGLSLAFKSGMCNPYPKGDYTLIGSREESQHAHSIRTMCITTLSVVIPVALTALTASVVSLAAARFNSSIIPV